MAVVTAVEVGGQFAVRAGRRGLPTWSSREPLSARPRTQVQAEAPFKRASVSCEVAVR